MSKVLIQLLEDFSSHKNSDVLDKPFLYERLQDPSFIIMGEEKLPSFATITIAELNEFMVSENFDDFCPTTIFDAVANGRLDVVKWCRENGHVDEHYCRIYHLPIPPVPACQLLNGRSYPWSPHHVLDGLCKCRNVEHLNAVVTYLCLDTGDGKHYNRNLLSDQVEMTGAVMEMCFARNHVGLRWYRDEGYKLLGPLVLDGTRVVVANDLLTKEENIGKMWNTSEAIECFWPSIQLFTMVPTESLMRCDGFAPLLWYVFDMHHPVSCWKEEDDSKLSSHAVAYRLMRLALQDELLTHLPLPECLVYLVDSYLSIWTLLVKHTE